MKSLCCNEKREVFLNGGERIMEYWSCEMLKEKEIWFPCNVSVDKTKCFFYCVQVPRAQTSMLRIEACLDSSIPKIATEYYEEIYYPVWLKFVDSSNPPETHHC